MSAYYRQIPVEFNHCDPAGIVFYPRYFEMTNSVVENFFADAVGLPFAAMMRAGQGVPTVQIAAGFTAPSRLGDRLTFSLSVIRVGGASVALRLAARAGEEARMQADITLVWLQQGGPAPWPDAIRTRLSAHLEVSDDQPA